jgi:hypothetical protein
VKRFLAVLAAVGMIAGALYIRGRIDDDGGGGSRGNGGGGDTTAVVCAPELAAACREVSDDVVVEDAAATAGRLLDADRPLTADGREFDTWVTPGPWPAMVQALREPESLPALFEGTGEPVASTRLGVVGPPDVPTGWRGVGDAVVGGDLDLGWRPPDSGLGVVQVGAFAVGYFEGPDFAVNDFDSTFRAYLEGISTEAEQAPVPLARRLQFGVAFAEAALAPEAEARALLEGAAPGRREGLAPLYPEPVISVEAVLVGDDLADDLAGALEEDGWDVPAGRSGLPRPGVLAALWEEVRR